MAGWSLKRLVTVALLLSFSMVGPLAAIVYFRLHQVRSEAPRWAALAQASRRLAQAETCGGAASSVLARDDLERWRVALVEIGADRAGWLGESPLAGRVAALAQEVDSALRLPADNLVPWLSAHCAEARGVAATALERALLLGMEPSSRADRHEDLAIRDVTVYLALWLAAAVLLLVWARRRVTYPAVQLANVLARVAEGDLAVKIPVTAGGEMQRLAAALEVALARLAELDSLKAERIGELRSLVLRLVELVEQPVLVIGVDETIDYANAVAGAALGEDATRLTGLELAKLPGGAALVQLVRGAVASDEGHMDQLLETNALARERHVAHCALVRDNRGRTTRVIVVLKSAEGPWWRRLWRANDGDR